MEEIIETNKILQTLYSPLQIKKSKLRMGDPKFNFGTKIT